MALQHYYAKTGDRGGVPLPINGRLKTPGKKNGSHLKKRPGSPKDYQCLW